METLPVDNNCESVTQEEDSPYVLQLKQKLIAANERIQELQTETETLKQSIRSIFNDDQIECLWKGRMKEIIIIAYE